MSKYKLITRADEADIPEWNKFIFKHPSGNIFQSPEYYSLISSQRNVKPITLFIIDSESRILGILIGEHLFENKFYKK